MGMWIASIFEGHFDGNYGKTIEVGWKIKF
jgi:hypothetical protein